MKRPYLNARRVQAESRYASPKKTRRLTINEGEMKDKMPTLRQNQKSCKPTLNSDPMQHICFCPNRTIKAKLY